MTGNRVSLSKKQLETPTGAELLKLCQRVKTDGRLSKDEIIALLMWLRGHQDADLPAVEYLSSVAERIVADNRVTVSEMQELHEAIEKILPRDVRKVVVERRKAVEDAVKQRLREKQRADRDAEKQAEKERRRQEREQRRRNMSARPAGFHSKIAGTSHRNKDRTSRQEIIRDNVRRGMQLIVKREPDNPYGDTAISLWVKTRTFGIFETERQLGYLNSSVSCDLAPYLDGGGWVRVTVSDVTGGGDKYYGVNIFIEDGREVL